MAIVQALTGFLVGVALGFLQLFAVSYLVREQRGRLLLLVLKPVLTFSVLLGMMLLSLWHMFGCAAGVLTVLYTSTAVLFIRNRKGD